MSVSSEDRLRGRKLQQTRLRIWAHDPRCARCRTLTDYPSGFELDHIAPVHKGGSNEDENLEVLCHACHEVKTADDLGRRHRPRVGRDGWPEAGAEGRDARVLRETNGVLRETNRPGRGGQKLTNGGPETAQGAFFS